MRLARTRLWLLVLLTGITFLAGCATTGGHQPLTAEESSVRVAADGMEFVRTPDRFFENLPGYDFEPHYATVSPGQLRMHYVDEGPVDAPVVLLVHGNPAWSYLVRDMIPILVEEGYRVIAPDIIGFGRSDKPVARSAHTYDNHAAWMVEFLQILGLEKILLHAHDWGGFIMMRVAALEGDRFSAVAISNTGLPMGQPLPRSFLTWRNSLSQKISSYEQVMRLAVPTKMTSAERFAYEAPYPTEQFKAGPRHLPQEMPIDADDPECRENIRLFEEEWRRWEKPFIVLNGEATGGEFSEMDQQLIDEIPGASEQPHAILPGSAHYLQEDVPEELTARLVEFFRSAQ